MKKMFCVAFISMAIIGFMSSQESNTNGIVPKKILFAYEESNEKLEPWISRFSGAFSAANLTVDKKAAIDLASADLSKYDLIVIYGAVMAFASKEPLRDWLKAENRLSGKKVALFVTANRWFLKKYDDQLLGLLKKKNATVVDAVSGATKDLTESEKQKIVDDFIGKLNR
jgi:hypothetical protein